jgi:two-component system phosphate regulon sensor histidine kinase PhoR
MTENITFFGLCGRLAMRFGVLPWVSLLFGLLALLVLWVAGVAFGVIVASALLMLGSLIALWWWIDEQPPLVAPARPLNAELRAARAQAENAAVLTIGAMVEAVGLPLIVIERGRVLSANAAARAVLGEHILGQDPRVALRHPEAVALLEPPMEGEASVSVANLTSGGSLWQLTRRAVSEGRWAIELRDRSAEADMSRAHTDFVANASHELRTPLASVIGYVETLADAPGALDEAVAKRFLGTVLREARRMQNLVSDLMSLSQLEAEKHDAPTQSLDFGALVARVAGEFAPVPGEAGRVVLARPEGALPVSGDAKQLEQLVRNLIDNALKYGDDDKPVRVDVSKAVRGMAQICVADHGAGIAPDHLPHLTRRFYRTDPGRSRAGGGTGLGLAIVKHVVERHRGKLDISSQLGVGTQVKVRLPLNAA